MRSSYSVYPRYTAGSPAGVSEQLCLRVLKQEREAIEYVLLGYVGEDQKRIAETQGLAGIAIQRWESRGYVYSKDLATDTITKQKAQQPRYW